MTSHADARATLLANGKVLVVDGLTDGYFGPQVLAAELYDPATDTFSATGSLLPGGAGVTATRLKDGRVLLTGGDAAASGTDLHFNNVAPATAPEIYDPASGTFSLTGPMVEVRADLGASQVATYTATLLGDGRVLIVGGEYNGKYLSSAELYDPASGKFTATGSMRTGRENQTATLLADGRVLIAGGDEGHYRLDTHILDSAEIYDPASGQFNPAGTMITARRLHTATRLSDGRVLIAGGAGLGSDGLAAAEIYDPTKAAFKPAGSMVEPRSYHAACLLGDGEVLLVGGYRDPLHALDSAELYDPSSGAFSKAGILKMTPYVTQATLLQDGRVFIVSSGDAAQLYWP